MIKVPLELDYGKLPGDVKEAKQLTEILIGDAVMKAYPSGMPRTESRMYSKVLNQFYQNPDELEVDETTFKFLKESLEKAEFMPHFSAWKWRLIDHLEKLAVREPDKKD